MKSIVYLVLVGVTIICLETAAQTTDYCDKTLCGDSKHIGCKNSGNFSKSCPKGRASLDINTEFKNAIVKKHNQLRNKLANGKFNGFKPCPRMATMQWDNELAKLAEMNVKTCKFAHDACHNTKKFPQSGQNLAQTWSNEPFTTSTQATGLPLIDSWWSEYKNTTMKDINSYPEKPKFVIGHFTVMAVENNNFVGCAIATYKDKAMNKWDSYLMACNYAATNIVNGKIYTSGKTASQCKSGTNPSFKGLCSDREQY